MFRLDTFADVPVALKKAYPKSEPRYYLLIFPLFLSAALLSAYFPKFAGLWWGLCFALFLGSMVMTFLHDQQQYKITRLVDSRRLRPKDAGLSAPGNAGKEA